MDVPLNYQKRKNQALFKDLEQHKGIQLSNLQNYIPIYQKLFALNNTNYNSINLNHVWSLETIQQNKQLDKKKETKERERDQDRDPGRGPGQDQELDSYNDFENIFTCILQNSSLSDISFEQPVFFKMAPLLDPFKYIVGKYNHEDANLFTLPTLTNNEHVHPKLVDVNNSSYVDGFFGFLSSQLLNHKKFIHGVDYYGSFLAIKNNFKLNIIDDLDYLIKSEFFNKHKNSLLFQVEDYSHLIEYNSPGLIPITIHSDSNLQISAKSIDEEVFEHIFDNTEHASHASHASNASHINLSEVDAANPPSDLIDMMNHNPFELNNNNNNNMTIKSTSTCSSRTSHTHTESSHLGASDNDNDNDISGSGSGSGSDYEKDNDEDQDFSQNSSDFSDEEEKLFVQIPKFPVQVIAMEKCENTFDDLILNNELSKEEWFSAFMQIIMNLLTYQKMFSFTHNDLHTNNIMYNTTSIKFIYYVYNKEYYKVPTFGRIYKIIDFGRAIYKFQGKIFCSDSFQSGGDAATQYNTEPFFNEKKPRLEPNYSFDLCRLACSIFDYVVDDFDNLAHLEKTNPVVKLIVEWCLDDNGLNVLYKNNGDERYPDFKLYKMIARGVHKHTPVAQLNRPEFKKYILQKPNTNSKPKPKSKSNAKSSTNTNDMHNLPKDAVIMNIDNM